VTPLDLDGIAWDELRHAYGPATDVPKLLRSLAESPTRSEIDEIEGTLWSSVLHQGNVYTATPVTLELLFELMADPAREVGPAFAHWLVDLVDIFSWDTDHPVVLRTRAVVVEALPKLLWLLDAGDRDSQGCVIGVLGAPTGVEAYCWDQLHGFFERQARIDLKAEALMSMASISDQAGKRAETVLIVRRLFEGADPFERCTGATALVVLEPSSSAPRRYLTSLLPVGLPALAGRESWWGVGLPRTILDMLLLEPSWPGPDDVALAIDTICSIGSVLPTQLDTLLQRLFPANEEIPSLASDLTDDQRLVMSKLAEADGFLVYGKRPEPPSHLLNQLWLPSTPEGIKKWLNGAPRTKCVPRRMRKVMKQASRSYKTGL
jgi:hypothetical protein